MESGCLHVMLHINSILKVRYTNYNFLGTEIKKPLVSDASDKAKTANKNAKNADYFRHANP